jgi:hypothetical protein
MQRNAQGEKKSLACPEHTTTLRAFGHAMSGLTLPLRFALLCFALLCFALLCFALLCFALLCFALFDVVGGVVILPSMLQLV